MMVIVFFLLLQEFNTKITLMACWLAPYSTILIYIHIGAKLIPTAISLLLP